MLLLPAVAILAIATTSSFLCLFCDWAAQTRNSYDVAVDSGIQAHEATKAPAPAPAPEHRPVTEFQTLERQYSPVIGTIRAIEWRKGVEAGKAYVHWDQIRISRQSTGNWSQQPIQFHMSNDLGKIERIAVWGERHSCTNYLTNLLQTWWGPILKNCGQTKCVTGGEKLWKHDFLRNADGSNATTLHILITKDPYEWVESMQKLPYHAFLSRHKRMKDFLAGEWVEFARGAYTKEMTKEIKAMSGRMRVKKAGKKVRQAKLGIGKTRRILGEAYECSVAPGYPVGAVAEGLAPASCLSAEESREACGGSWLCKEGQQQLWFSQGKPRRCMR